MESSSNFVLLLLLTIGVVVTIVRILAIVYQRSNPKSSQPLSSLIVLGSGGHTAEMLNLLNVLPMERFKPRFYIAAATDNMSLQKARVYEDSLLDKVRVGSSKSNAILEDSTRVRLHFWRVRAALSSTWLSVLCIARLSVIGVDAVGRAEFMQIYRSREVGQSYITSIGTTTIAMAHALWLMIKIRPKVILCNGPGTCIPLCVIAFFFKVLGIRWSSIFYVESIARVRRLSLSGLLLYKLRIVDQLFVQWPQLKEKYPRAHYVGCLM